MASDAILVTWDHREEVPIDEVSAAAQRGFVHMYAVDDTYGDFYAMVASTTPLEGNEVQQTFENLEAWPSESVVPAAHQPQEYRTLYLEIEIVGQDTIPITDSLGETMRTLETDLDINDWRFVESPVYRKVEA